MTARQSWEPNAGPWVAYRDEPRSNGGTMRMYALSMRSAEIAPVTAQALRFDTRREALEFARAKWPFKARGCRIGAEKVAAPTSP